MRCACIDIGSNTTRVLVADVSGGELREVVCEKAFTRLGSTLRRSRSLPGEALGALAGVVAGQRQLASALGAERIRVVATAAIRAAPDADALVAAIAERAGVPVEVLAAPDEARLAFAGATRSHRGPLDGLVAVVDVGGGSTEVAVGTLAGGVRWSLSIPVGSSTLADDHLRQDPPAEAELRALRDRATSACEVLDGPRPAVALAVGGSATSMASLVPGAVDRVSVERAIAILREAPRAQVAAAHGLDPERVRLLPAGLHLLDAVAQRLACPMTVGDGGLREGVCLELAASR